MSRVWGARAFCGVSVLLQASCGGGGGGSEFDFSDVTCDRTPPGAYLLSVAAGFVPAQLVDLEQPSATYVAVLRVGESAQLQVTAHTVGQDNCSGRITAVAWATSDAQLAAAQGTGRATGLLTGLAPGEVTLQARASFQDIGVDVPYMFATNGPRIRAVRVVP